MALILSLLAGLATLGVTGAAGRWPWRAVDLLEVARDDHRPTGRAVVDPARHDGCPVVPAAGRASRRRGDRRRAEALEKDLPVAVDLLRVAVSAGHSLHTAVVAVGRAGTGPACAALRVAASGYDRGGRLVDELERLPTALGPELRPLTTTLVVAASSGSPLGPALERLADAERRRLRRRTEARVRRLPVLLLAPLLGLILPAFVVLTVVPVGLTTARVGLQPAHLPASGPPPSSLPPGPSVGQIPRNHPP